MAIEKETKSGIGLEDLPPRAEKPAEGLGDGHGIGRSHARFAYGNENKGRQQHQRRRQREDQSMGEMEFGRLQQVMGKAGGTERQNAAAEKTPGQHAAAGIGWDHAADDIVIGHADDAADEGIERPENEKARRHGHRRQIARGPEQEDNTGETEGATKGTDGVVGHPAPRPPGEEPDHDLRHQPSEAENRAGDADQEDISGQLID